MILVINPGSSTLKYSLFDGDKLVKSAKIDRIGSDGVINHAQAWEKLYQGIGVHAQQIEGVGYRVVHGGAFYRDVAEINPNVINNLKKIENLAPLHMPQTIEVIQTVTQMFQHIKHFAVFDTAFFQEMPQKAYEYPLPREIVKEFGIKRYGFHGINHRWALRVAQEKLGMIRTQHAISLHLGSGSSIAAIKEGKCIDISMGFTPLEGLMMMTRAGDLDSGIILHLLRNGKTLEEIEKILNRESGIIGICNISNDMRDILYLGGYKVEDEGYKPAADLNKDDETIEAARLAIEMYVYRIIKYVGAYIAALGGLDTLIFTGEIGARSSEIRKMIMSNLQFISDWEIVTAEPNEEYEIKLEVEKNLNNINKAKIDEEKPI